jgi:hypothetical protein
VHGSSFTTLFSDCLPIGTSRKGGRSGV